MRDAGCFVLVAAVSAAIGFGYIYGAGYGWLFFAAFCVMVGFEEQRRERRKAKTAATQAIETERVGNP